MAAKCSARARAFCRLQISIQPCVTHWAVA